MPVVPATLNYHDPNDARLMDYHVIIAGRGSVLNNSFYKNLQAAGRRVVQYIDFVDAWDVGPFDKLFVTGAPTLADSGLGVPTNWGGKLIVDIGDTAWQAKALEAMKKTLSYTELDDLMLDVFGTRMWTSTGWGRMSLAQRDRYANAARVLADKFGQIRDQYRPTARLYANGTWNGEGNPNLCPAIENHDNELTLDPGNYWWKYINSLQWDTKGQGAAIVYCKSLAAAQKWAQVPGVGPVCVHPTNYFGPSGIKLPYAALTPRAGGTPPPPPDPTPDYAALLAKYNALVEDFAALEQELNDEIVANTSLAASLVKATERITAIKAYVAGA